MLKFAKKKNQKGTGAYEKDHLAGQARIMMNEKQIQDTKKTVTYGSDWREHSDMLEQYKWNEDHGGKGNSEKS